MRGIARPRLLVGLCLVLGLSLGLAACGGSASSSGGGGGEAVTGNIRIEGSSTVYPITQAAAELFREENPDARIEVGGAGTSDGFEAFCQGDTQISDASRPIEAEEMDVCEENGVEFIEIPVAYDGISVVVNKKGNDWATDITSEELKKIWEPSAEGKVTKWSQVNPDWPDKPLDLYGPGTESGTYEFFNGEIVGNEEEVNRQSDVEMSEDDNVLVQGVSGDANALGYFGYSYYENNLDTLKALAVDGVKPTQDTIRSGEYLTLPPAVHLREHQGAEEQQGRQALRRLLPRTGEPRPAGRGGEVRDDARPAWRRSRGRNTRTAPRAPCSTRTASRRAATWRRRCSSRSRRLCRDGSA